MSRVTVLVAAYNAGKYLEECLESLLDQTHRDLQIVCIDDASTDSTPDILKRYAAADDRKVYPAFPLKDSQDTALLPCLP